MGILRLKLLQQFYSPCGLTADDGLRSGTMSAPLLCECSLSALARPSGTGNTYSGMSVMIDFSGGPHILNGQRVPGTAYLDVDGKHLY